jgi:hypothetical protein
MVFFAVQSEFAKFLSETFAVPENGTIGIALRTIREIARRGRFLRT